MTPKHRKILIIESSAELTDRIRTPLEEEGYMTQVAADGPDGLIRAGRYQPDLVIVGFRLRSSSGLDVCKNLRKDKPASRQRILMVVDEAQLEKLEIGPRSNVDDYLVIPFSRADLLTKIAPLLIDPNEQRAKTISTGNAELDNKMAGGVPLGSLTLIEGDSGAGKSVLTQQWMFGCIADGLTVTVFTSENTVKSLVKQMRSLNLDILDALLLGRLRAIPIETSRKGKEAPRALLDAMRTERGRDLVVIDSLTASIPQASDKEVIGFFEEAKRMYPERTTVFIVIHSHGLTKELLSRIRSLCDAHFQLRTEQVGNKLVKMLEVTKVRGAENTTGNIVSFEVEPGWGMRVIPINKVKG